MEYVGTVDSTKISVSSTEYCKRCSNILTGTGERICKECRGNNIIGPGISKTFEKVEEPRSGRYSLNGALDFMKSVEIKSPTLFGNLFCANCTEPIIRQYIALSDNYYHPLCFICKLCGEACVEQGRALFAAYDSLNGPTCVSCDRNSRAANTVIIRSLEDDNFMDDEVPSSKGEEVNNNSYLTANKSMPKAIITDQTIGIREIIKTCAKCRLELSGAIVRLGDDSYHRDCLVCYFCNAVLVSVDGGKKSNIQFIDEYPSCLSCIEKHKNRSQPSGLVSSSADGISNNGLNQNPKTNKIAVSRHESTSSHINSIPSKQFSISSSVSVPVSATAPDTKSTPIFASIKLRKTNSLNYGDDTKPTASVPMKLTPAAHGENSRPTVAVHPSTAPRDPAPFSQSRSRSGSESSYAPPWKLKSAVKNGEVSALHDSSHSNQHAKVGVNKSQIARVKSQTYNHGTDRQASAPPPPAQPLYPGAPVLRATQTIGGVREAPSASGLEEYKQKLNPPPTTVGPSSSRAAAPIPPPTGTLETPTTGPPPPPTSHQLHRRSVVRCVLCNGGGVLGPDFVLYRSAEEATEPTVALYAHVGCLPQAQERTVGHSTTVSKTAAGGNSVSSHNNESRWSVPQSSSPSSYSSAGVSNVPVTATAKDETRRPVSLPTASNRLKEGVAGLSLSPVSNSTARVSVPAPVQALAAKRRICRVCKLDITGEAVSKNLDFQSPEIGNDGPASVSIEDLLSSSTDAIKRLLAKETVAHYHPQCIASKAVCEMCGFALGVGNLVTSGHKTCKSCLESRRSTREGATSVSLSSVQTATKPTPVRQASLRAANWQRVGEGDDSGRGSVLTAASPAVLDTGRSVEEGRGKIGETRGGRISSSDRRPPATKIDPVTGEVVLAEK